MLFSGIYFADNTDESGLEFKLRYVNLPLEEGIPKQVLITSYHSTFVRNDRWRLFSDEKVV